MIVTPIASTTIVNIPQSVYDTNFGERLNCELGRWTSEDADLLAELAGRACYQAWEMPNERTANNAGYIANILKQGHESVLEHSSVTFYVEGVSRSLTHELIRHRHLSFSELSQRYVNMDDYRVVMPPAIESTMTELQVRDAEHNASIKYREVADDLTDRGYNRKEVREAARAVLPGGMETKIVVTGNLRAWRDVLKKRWSLHADWEIRDFAGEILRHLRDLAPNSVSDIPEEPYE